MTYATILKFIDDRMAAHERVARNPATPHSLRRREEARWGEARAIRDAVTALAPNRPYSDGVTPAAPSLRDAAEAVVRCAAMWDDLPLNMKLTVQDLASAIGVQEVGRG
jgi:hypothetical protein